MKSLTKLLASGLLALMALWSSLAAAEALKPNAKVAFFGVTFIDTSTEGAYFGARDDEAERLQLVTDYVTAEFRERGFVFSDIEPVREELDRTVNPADCNGCEVRMAGKLGADYSLVGEIQKVSNLILSMNLVVRNATTGEMAKGMSVDIRGNTDESWKRGMGYIMRNNIFRE